MAAKNEPRGSIAPVKRFTDSLFDAESPEEIKVLPVSFLRCKPQVFAHVFLERLRSVAGKKMTAFAWARPEIYGPVIEKLAKARPHLLGKDIDEIFAAIEICLDYGVLGAEVFTPSIMPGGALLVRNLHRVISFDTAPTIVINVRPDELKSELSACLLACGDAPDTLNGLSVIQRLADDEITWLGELPAELSGVGQSLILVGEQFDATASRLLTDLSLAYECAESRTGVVAIRTFGTFATVHRGVRIDDRFDTLLEEFAAATLTEINEPQNIHVTQHIPSLVDSFHERALDLYDKTGMPTLSGDPCRHYLERLVGAKEKDGWGHKKLTQCLDLLPIFARSSEMPAMPGFIFPPLFTATRVGLCGVIEFRGRKASELSRPVDAVLDAIKTAKKTITRVENTKVVVTSQTASALELLLLEKTIPRSSREPVIRDSLSEWAKEKPEHPPLVDSIAPVKVCIFSKDSGTVPSITSLANYVKIISANHTDLSVVLTVPSIGLIQSFEDGCQTLGNMWAYLPQTEFSQ